MDPQRLEREAVVMQDGSSVETTAYWKLFHSVFVFPLTASLDVLDPEPGQPCQHVPDSLSHEF